MNKLLKTKTFLLAILFSSFFGFPKEVDAAVINSSSCQQVDIQTAIEAASSGDVVNVPPGECNWSSSVTIPNNKKITLQGAGIDSTVINGSAVNLGQSGSRLTGFTINEGSVNVDGDGWRIDHCKIYRAGSSGTGISVRGTRSSAAHPTGLIDNCLFFNSRVVVMGTAAMLNEGGQQHILWTTPLDLGTNNSIVYVEDNIFNYNVFGNVMDANYGGAYVFRFNTVNGAYIEAHSVQSTNRATRRWEIYNNTIGDAGVAAYYPFRIRGGTGVVFNNTVASGWTNYGIGVDNVRSYADAGAGGFCDGDSPWDGNEDSTGYPCRDQIGRGPDEFQWNHNPILAYSQPLVPAYSWENRRVSNNDIVSFRAINNSSQHIKENRDIYNQLLYFDGTSGVGSGPVSNRPATCVQGVGYWAIDQGEWNSENIGNDGHLYKCASTNTWELYYTPYTYPHPLQSSALLFRADVDGSLEINTTDALLTLRNSLGLSMNGTAWQASATTGDVNCDGVSNSTDALLILRYSLGLSMDETGWCE